MRRGFKTRSEERASTARCMLKIGELDPIDPWAYAAHLNVVVLDFRTIGLSNKANHRLTVEDSESWSAMTLKDGNQHAIVLNPSHAATRQKNDLMHELAHIELLHVPARVDISQSGMLLLSDFSDEQEQEADWHAAAILLPRTVLLHHRSRGADSRAIAQMYGVSEALCEWRLRMTGVEVQLRRGRG